VLSFAHHQPRQRAVRRDASSASAARSSYRTRARRGNTPGAARIGRTPRQCLRRSAVGPRRALGRSSPSYEGTRAGAAPRRLNHRAGDPAGCASSRTRTAALFGHRSGSTSRELGNFLTILSDGIAGET
jgi:hypothetical protein